jgi:hypothetical protein
MLIANFCTFFKLLHLSQLFKRILGAWIDGWITHVTRDPEISICYFSLLQVRCRKRYGLKGQCHEIFCYWFFS